MDTTMLKELGFETAAKELDRKKEVARKMMVAYENFRFVSPKVVERFQEALKERTFKETGTAGRDLRHHYDYLVFLAVKDYREAPPVSVLESMKKALGFGCFDRFEVAKIESRVEYKDPILFGVIEGCQDRFYIDQWDSDVKIEDLLGEMEG